MSEIKKAVKKRAINKKKHREIASTGCDLFDHASGGFRFGTIINIVGDNSTGKTLLASELIASARAKYGKKLKWKYDDAEAGYSFNSEAMYGFEIIADDEKPSETVEDFDANLDNALNNLKSDEYLIYVLDSLDSLSSLEEQERAIKRRKDIINGKKPDGTYGLEKQKFMSEFFRSQINRIKEKNCLLIIINQVRENISIFPGPKYKRMGGKGLDFYAAQIWWLAVTEKFEKKGNVVGVCIKARNTKNKNPGPPFRSCYIDVIFDYGIDNLSTNLCHLFSLKTDKGKLSKDEKAISKMKEFMVKWDKKNSKGRDIPPKFADLIEYAETNDLEDSIKELSATKWDTLQKEISSDNRKERRFK